MKLYSAEEAEALAAAATPGPWCVGDDLIVWPADDVAVAFDTVGCAASYLDEALSRANAAIMAAAPDLARSVAHHARQAAELEAEVARLRAIIAAERGLAAQDGWEPNGEGWSNFGDEWGDNSRHARPVGRGSWNGQEFLAGTWWEWSVDERIGGLLMPGRRGRGYAPTALEAMEAADAAAGVARG